MSNNIYTTEVQASSMEELATLYINLKDIVGRWCESHKNYQYKLSQNTKDKTITLKLAKGE